jgi:hypothetical protein
MRNEDIKQFRSQMRRVIFINAFIQLVINIGAIIVVAMLFKE